MLQQFYPWADAATLLSLYLTCVCLEYVVGSLMTYRNTSMLESVKK